MSLLDQEARSSRSRLMGRYLFVHHFPKGFQGSPETAAAATAWFRRIEPNLAGRTPPAAELQQFGDPGAEPVPAAYEVITADDAEVAMDLAKAWPLLTRGGRIEVRELTTERFTLPASAEAVTAEATSR
jgi:hypothetical protein